MEGKISVPWPAEGVPLWCCSVWASLPLLSLWREEGPVWAIATSLGSSSMIVLASVPEQQLLARVMAGLKNYKFKIRRSRVLVLFFHILFLVGSVIFLYVESLQ